MRMSWGVGPLSNARIRETASGVIVRAAFVALILGRGFSALGTGGGLAAVCGAAASLGIDAASGITTGGESEREESGWVLLVRSADIIARLG